MNWKNRLTNYNFWISIFSAVLLILQALKIEFDIAYVNEIFTAVLGLLVVIGIISDPTRTSVKSNESSSAVKNKKEEVQNQSQKVEKPVEENKLPFNKENEVVDADYKSDLQTILANISTDLDNKMKELKQFNLETVNKLIKNESEKISFLKEQEKEETQSKEGETSPAVAETGNPYFDVIN